MHLWLESTNDKIKDKQDIHYLYFLVYKKEKNTQEALLNLEQCYLLVNEKETLRKNIDIIRSQIEFEYEIRKNYKAE